ncbi:hypothetical protein [Bosea sp. PAMC 26642]|uniref:hypothetical protein n=1 Tax=Bosea sp. (strain PAMC 26642) TaxID=1792307 RepID=UPI00076FED60|nr:hypothetical protein [Bosea sp. PAMC 26642]AMJ63249.1 hypothetical protein AXW83_25725 [Bosea sp. PAMC 26642]
MTFAYQVELKLDPTADGERLSRIESWCTEWQLGFRILQTLDRTVRVAFEDPRYARAFHSQFGGAVVPIDDVNRAMGADADAEDAYDRLANEYDFQA